MTQPPQPPEPALPPEPPGQLVSDYDPVALSESFADPSRARARAEELRQEIRSAPDEIAELIARADLVDILRALGEEDEALREALAAVDRADIAGSHAQQHTARIRLARVHQVRGEFGDANALHTELLAAAAEFGPVVEAFTYQHAGENDLAQGHTEDAAAHFARALRIREELDLAEAAQSRSALAAARRVLTAQPTQGPEDAAEES